MNIIIGAAVSGALIITAVVAWFLFEIFQPFVMGWGM